MSAAFTPGPWSFDGPPSSRIVWAGTDLRVCFLTSDGPNLANARLIAAAPDLYVALEHILSGALSLPRFAEQEARAALAKASAIEARRAAAENTDAVHESATRQGDAQ